MQALVGLLISNSASPRIRRVPTVRTLLDYARNTSHHHSRLRGMPIQGWKPPGCLAVHCVKGLSVDQVEVCYFYMSAL